MDLMHKLKEIINNLRINGFKIAYNPIDDRRKQFYSKLFS